MHRCYSDEFQEVNCCCYSIWRGRYAVRWIFSAARAIVASLASIRYLHVIFLWCSPQHRIFQFSNFQVRLLLLKTVCVLYLFTHCWFTNSPLKTTCLAGKAYIVEAYFLKRPSALNKSNFSLFEWNEISEKCFFSDNGGGLGINNVTCGAGSFSVASAVTDFPAHRKI